MENIDEMICPICGETYNPIDAVINDAGNPICPNCASKEDEE